MPIIKAEFDGKVFIPCEVVGLPAGTKVDVVLPGAPLMQEGAQRASWDLIQEQIDASTPAFPTVEEAIRYSRKRP